MKHKLGFLAASCTALVAFFGFSASAFALHDPACNQWGNQFGVYDFQIDTPDSHRERAVSGVTGSGYACGSEIGWFYYGAETLYNHADVSVPPGVEIADSDLVPNGSYAAGASVNVLYHGPAGVSYFRDAVSSEVRTDYKAMCEWERDHEIVGPTPRGQIVSCLKGVNELGHSWSWATRVISPSQTDRNLSLTIGPMHGVVGVEPGLTYIDLDLCAYYGTVEGTECGSGGRQWQQKNGHASYPNCTNGNGVYTMTATNNAGETTDPAEACVEWTPKGFPPGSEPTNRPQPKRAGG